MQSYRQLLVDEFARRKTRNASYSQRAYARDLSLSPAYLTQVLKGQKNLSPDKASSLTARLDWSSRRKDLFLNLVRLDSARTEEHKSAIRKELAKKKQRILTYKEIKLDTVQVVTNWYYHAILTLTEVANFKYDEAWIAKRIGIPLEQVHSAITVLKNLNLVREENGTLVPQFEMLRGESVPSRAIRDHHRQFLKKAEQALETQEHQERDITGSTIAINSKKLPEAKKLIKEFRESLTALLNDPGNNDHVYRLSVELFRIDQKDSK